MSPLLSLSTTTRLVPKTHVVYPLRGSGRAVLGNTEEPHSLSVSAPANTELFTQAARVFAE